LERNKRIYKQAVGCPGSNCMKNMDRFAEVCPMIQTLFLLVFPSGPAGLLVTERAVQCGTAGDKGETADRAANDSF